MGNNNYGDLNRWIDIETDKNVELQNYKTKKPGLDIPEPELQPQTSNNSSNQENPT